MKVKYAHVTLKPEAHHIYDESMFGVSDLHVITRDGFVTINFLASDGQRRGKTWPAASIETIDTVL